MMNLRLWKLPRSWQCSPRKSPETLLLLVSIILIAHTHSIDHHPLLNTPSSTNCIPGWLNNLQVRITTLSTLPSKNWARCSVSPSTVFLSGTLPMLSRSKYLGSWKGRTHGVGLHYTYTSLVARLDGTTTPQMQYQVIFSLWLLTFEPQIASEINE
jgi:hypothetical protein